MAEFSANLTVTLGPMDSSKHLTKIALFPLCDVQGVLIDTLCATSEKSGSRADALLFAWRLALPEGMDIGKAADAVLVVAMSISRKSWSERQLFILHELTVLAGRKGSVPSVRRVNKKGLLAQHPERRARDVIADRDAVDDIELAPKTIDQPAANSASKESTKWWKLVGRDPLGSNSEKRKTRKQRVFREP